MTLYNRIQNSIVHRIQKYTNKYIGKLRLTNLKSKSFTVISNNCWAGSVYRYYNLPYNSPTVGLYFFSRDYIKFLNNLRYYCTHRIECIDVSQSKYRELLISKHQENVPIGRIDDIEVIFLHYSSFAEAKEKWQRRVNRIVWGNLFIKMSEMNGCTIDDIYEFDKLPFENKVIFTTQDYGIKSQVIMKQWKGDNQIKDDTTWFNKYIDITAFLNGCLKRRRQK